MFFSRGLNKIQNPYNLTDIYPKYVEYVEKKEKYILSQSDFIKVCGEFNKRVVEAILDGKTFYMPSAMGHIDIQKLETFDPKYDGYIDWPNSVKYGKQIYHTNPHSDGYRYRVVWWRLDNQSRGGSKLYNFTACRDFKRTLAKLLKDRKVDYYENRRYGKRRVKTIEQKKTDNGI